MSRDKTDVQPASLEQETRTVIQESRMVLPGIQAVFGFQLIAIFNNRFQELTTSEQVLHLGALVLVAIAVALIMTPASYHRIAEKGLISRRFVELGSRLLTCAMLPLLLGMTIDIFIVAHLVLKEIGASIVLAVLIAILFLTLWYLLPWGDRRFGRAATIPLDRNQS